MKRMILFRTLNGVVAGIALSHAIALLSSLGSGAYLPCAPALITACGSVLRAVVLQTVLSAVLGAVFGAASVTWSLEHWSIARQTAVYFTVTAAVMLPAAYACCWTERSLTGVLRYGGIYLGIFALIWLLQFLAVWRSVRHLNNKLE